MMATDIQIQINNTESELFTIHPLKKPDFVFTLPKYVRRGDFSNNDLDNEVNSD